MKASGLTGEEPVIDCDIRALLPLKAVACAMYSTTMYNQAKPVNTTGICAEVHKPGQTGPITCRRWTMEECNYLT